MIDWIVTMPYVILFFVLLVWGPRLVAKRMAQDIKEIIREIMED